ncbi:LacI family DNA-binding transcriptional regulator [Plantactinospora sp. BC1]|uniref:LacI family DNA-binding transcriptional regulator n=1 Tax=Plantactinospora sp. BC1 TaxID=2108470 RepID=UPI00272A4E22|nr:LacI family DNA-binding transcriptional regulator [Plantactinospora sp. BC1]
MAAAAGVSLSTASRVLNGSTRTVAPEYAEKVLAAAAALRYTADASARAMRRASDSIALVADDLTTASISLVLAAMEREARSVDAFVTVASTGGTPSRQLETVRLMCAMRPRALVLTSSRLDTDLLQGRLLRELLAYQRDGGRVVIFGDTDMPFDAISVDNRASAAPVGSYLAKAGHRRVTIVAGAADRANVSDRAVGFTDGLIAGGVDSDDIRLVHCDVSREGGFAAVAGLLAHGPLDTQALVCANDAIAIGAMSALRAAGLRVPDEVSVTGFDDIPLATDVTPRLTTVAVPLARIGQDAIRLALGDHDEPRRTTEHGALVLRDSTRSRV